MTEPRFKLLACDIYRDGGSLGAVLSHSSGVMSLFLEIETWDHLTEPKVYRSLWVSDGEIPNADGSEVSPSSDTEKEWLARCNNAEHDDALKTRDLELFNNLVEALANRNN